MNIDWASLGLVAVTTVVAAIAIVGIFSLGVMALTSGAHDPGRCGVAERRGEDRRVPVPGRLRCCSCCTGCT